MARKSFTIEIGDEASLTENEIWPDGDAPENPTTDDVIAQIKATTSGAGDFRVSWGFDTHVYVDGKLVKW